METDTPDQDGAVRDAPFKAGTIGVALSLPALILLATTWHWEFGVITALLGLPPMLVLYLWWRPNRSACSLAHVIVAFGQGFWLLGSCATVLGVFAFYGAQVFATVIVVALFAWLPPLVQVLAVLVGGLCAFIAVEEACKLAYARWALRRRMRKAAVVGRASAAAKPFVIGAASASLGHASALSIILSLLVTRVFLADARIDSSEFGTIVLYAFLFAAASMPLNVLCAYMTALQLHALGPEPPRDSGARPVHATRGAAEAHAAADGGAVRPLPPARGGAPDATPGAVPPLPPARGGAPDATPGAPTPPANAAPALQPARERSKPPPLLTWPVGVRSLFSAQPLVWLTLFRAEDAVGTAVVVVLSALSGAGVYALVLRRVRALEAKVPSASASSARRRFGFALLATDDADEAHDGSAVDPPPYAAASQPSGGAGGARSVEMAQISVEMAQISVEMAQISPRSDAAGVAAAAPAFEDPAYAASHPTPAPTDGWSPHNVRP
ncbi:hypothetical protein KFE25_013873 [Diacronema lutheri]|uniref:Uncharacterized protein n=1 Tax=Diacronema lutheri TaxID=2081491 RepID=A0A8J5XJZ4_DIALT|nr:hypothetical protein KFE25_013873 [Diacronema lutheri]